MLDVEHEGLPIVRAELLYQSLDVLVLEVPLLRTEVLEALGGLVEFRLDAHHDGLAAAQIGQKIESVRRDDVLKGDADAIEGRRVPASAAWIPDSPVRRMHTTVLEAELDEVLPGDGILLAGAAVVYAYLIGTVCRCSPRRDDHQVDHYVHWHQVCDLILVAQHRSVRDEEKSVNCKI